MKLFISYSHDDKAWLLDFWRAMRDEGQHDAWIDQQVEPTQDWWETILLNIEDCQCLIYVLSPQSVESIYCTAQMNYALALNKPVLPLMLKPCDYPPQLTERGIQYQTLSEDMSLDKVLYRTEKGLTEIRIGLMQGAYPPDNAPRPAMPEPTQSQQTFEVFMIAEEAATEGNAALAEKLYEQVSSVDRTWGKAARQRLNEMLFEIQREAEYRTLVEMQKNLSLIKDTRAAVQAFIEKYGRDYDPNRIMPGLIQETTEIPLPSELRRMEVMMPNPADLTPGTRMIDESGIPMVYVPAGKFLMGEGEHQHEVEIARPFWLDLTPVTNESYAEFIRDKGYKTRKYWTPAGWDWVEAGEIKAPADYFGSTKPKQPRVGITWFEAYAYCQWRGGRLPTEAEWEWAARGPENRTYPWGNTFEAANVISKGHGPTAPVGDGIRTSGASWVGALDMIGNVWEWVNSIYMPYPYNASDGRESVEGNNQRVLRGGSNTSDEEILHAAVRFQNAHDRCNPGIGFRCARDVE
jgi:formylglycine-generating enzyme required for sulfatase activity